MLMRYESSYNTSLRMRLRSRSPPADVVLQSKSLQLTYDGAKLEHHQFAPCIRSLSSLPYMRHHIARLMCVSIGRTELEHLCSMPSLTSLECFLNERLGYGRGTYQKLKWKHSDDDEEEEVDEEEEEEEEEDHDEENSATPSEKKPLSSLTLKFPSQLLEADLKLSEWDGENWDGQVLLYSLPSMINLTSLKIASEKGKIRSFAHRVANFCSK